MKCDLCSAEKATQYEVEYGWLQKKTAHSSKKSVIETSFRPIGVLSRNVCSECARDYLRKYERWLRLGAWLGTMMSVLLFQLLSWISGSFNTVLWVPVFLLFMGFLFWSFRSIFTLTFQFFQRDLAIKEAIDGDIWRSNTDRLREDLYELEPHYVFHPDGEHIRKSTLSELGHWHFSEDGGLTYEYFVKPRVPNASDNWIR